jgi:ABC-type transport system involved in cytochrome c biogenesis permease component
VKFLPIAERELRVAARRRSTYWLRFSVPFGLLFITFWIFLVGPRESQRELGMVIFYMLTGGMTLFALTAGLRSTADSLSEEKREGTLGLLFLTDLRGYDVVIGKLLANSLAVFYGALAVLPILAVPLLMGGITGGEVGRLALVIVNTLFFSLSAGMLASALCHNSRAAIGVTLLVILIFAAGSPALGLLEARLRNWQGPYHTGFLWSSPVYSYVMGVDFYFGGIGATGYYGSMVLIHFSSWIFLALASRIVRHKWQDKPASVATEKRRGGWRSFWEGNAEVRLSFRRRLLDQNAFLWLAARPRQKAFWSWLPLVFAAGVWIWGWAKMRDDWFTPAIYAFTAYILALTYKVLVGAETGRRVLEDRKIGALELLLSTSLSVRDIIRGQQLALWRQFGRPIVALLLLSAILFAAGLADSGMNGEERVTWFWLGLAGVIVFVADTIALSWLGMWLGLAAKNPRHAFGAAIAPILALPWLGVAVVMTLITLLPYELRQKLRWESLPAWLWFGFSLMIDLGYGLYARHKLLAEFRLVAAQRFQPKPTWWQRLTGKSETREFS